MERNVDFKLSGVVGGGGGWNLLEANKAIVPRSRLVLSLRTPKIPAWSSDLVRATVIELFFSYAELPGVRQQGESSGKVAILFFLNSSLV